MKKLLFILSALLMVAAGSALAAADVFNVTLTIRQPIVITQVSALNFGTVELPTVLTTYTVNASAGPHTAGTGATAAEWSITGENAAVANVTIPASVNATVGATTLTFNLNASAPTITFGAGPSTLFVGGTVDVAPTADLGLYSTTATLTVLYQ